MALQSGHVFQQAGAVKKKAMHEGQTRADELQRLCLLFFVDESVN
jgi:hypothetical protein